MHKFLYEVVMCNLEDLQARLTELGDKGWRLHTCETVVTVGEFGTGLVKAFCVFDQMYTGEEEVEPDSEEPVGMAMG